MGYTHFSGVTIQKLVSGGNATIVYQGNNASDGRAKFVELCQKYVDYPKGITLVLRHHNSIQKTVINNKIINASKQNNVRIPDDMLFMCDELPTPTPAPAPATPAPATPATPATPAPAPATPATPATPVERKKSKGMKVSLAKNSTNNFSMWINARKSILDVVTVDGLQSSNVGFNVVIASSVTANIISSAGKTIGFIKLEYDGDDNFVIVDSKNVKFDIWDGIRIMTPEEYTEYCHELDTPATPATPATPVGTPLSVKNVPNDDVLFEQNNRLIQEMIANKRFYDSIPPIGGFKKEESR